MKCAASNKVLQKRQLYSKGFDEAMNTLSLYLDSVLKDKIGYSNTRIKQIHTSFNKVAGEVARGKRSVGSIVEFLHEDYGVVIDDNRIRPKGLRSDFVSGVHAAEDALTVVLIYVLMHIYRFGEDKCNAVMKGINYCAESVNRGFINNDEIRQCLLDEEKLASERLSMSLK